MYLLLLLLLLPDGRAQAVGETGTILGQVIDAGGLEVPRVLLVLSSSAATDIAATQFVSDDDGRFVFGEVAPGTYQVVAQKAGYGTTTRRDIVILAGRETPLTIELVSGGPTREMVPRKTVDTEGDYVGCGPATRSDYPTPCGLSRMPSELSPVEVAAVVARGSHGQANAPVPVAERRLETGAVTFSPPRCEWGAGHSVDRAGQEATATLTMD